MFGNHFAALVLNMLTLSLTEPFERLLLPILCRAIHDKFAAGSEFGSESSYSTPGFLEVLQSSFGEAAKGAGTRNLSG